MIFGSKKCSICNKNINQIRCKCGIIIERPENIYFKKYYLCLECGIELFEMISLIRLKSVLKKYENFIYYS